MIKPIQHAVNGIDWPAARCEQQVWDRETVGHDPLLGEAADGEEVLPFPFPFVPEEGINLRPDFGMEENKKSNPIRDSIQKD